MSRKHRAVVLGFYGRQNFGDDLFRTVLSKTLPHIVPGLRPLFLAPNRNPEELGKGLLPRWIPDELFTRAGRVSSAMRATAHAYAGLSCGNVVLGGGSVLEDVSPGFRLQEALGGSRRWYGLGVSLGPFESAEARRRVAATLGRFEVITVRDHASMEAARGLDVAPRVVYSGDLAGALDAETLARGAVRQHIGFAPCNNSTIPLPEQMTVLLDILDQQRLPVRVFALNNHVEVGDDGLARSSVRQLRSLGIEASIFRYADHGVAATSRAIASTELMISTRLHGGIVAYLAGRPVILLEYHPKCTAFLGDIGQSAELRVHRPGARHAIPDLRVLPAPTLEPRAYRLRTTQALRSLARLDART